MKTIVIGYLNTDLVATGLNQFPKSGELVYGKQLLIGAGGKSRNIADMLARLVPAGSVAMVGRTVRDPYGLWKVPMEALSSAGVLTDYVNIIDYEESGKLPGIALIPVDEQGNNQIIVLPGISDDFSPEDINNSDALFKDAGSNDGMLILTLECPLETAIVAVRKANEHGLKVMFDPGGVQDDSDISRLIQAGIYFIKPNEHEARMLTGIEVNDFEGAKAAAEALQKRGIPNVLITHGVKGAYLFGDGAQRHVPVPDVPASGEKDETGCGDEAMAAFCAYLQEGGTLLEAAKVSVLAGTLQFQRLGIKPVSKQELQDVASDS